MYSGLLRMVDLLALQNMDIRLHIVAPEERREKAFHEMLRPVSLSWIACLCPASCAFISYDSVGRQFSDVMRETGADDQSGWSAGGVYGGPSSMRAMMPYELL